MSEEVQKKFDPYSQRSSEVREPKRTWSRCEGEHILNPTKNVREATHTKGKEGIGAQKTTFRTARYLTQRRRQKGEEEKSQGRRKSNIAGGSQHQSKLLT